MPIKLICNKAHEKNIIESTISDYEKEGYMFHTIIPISSDPMYADMCIILEKHQKED